MTSKIRLPKSSSLSKDTFSRKNFDEDPISSFYSKLLTDRRTNKRRVKHNLFGTGNNIQDQCVSSANEWCDCNTVWSTVVARSLSTMSSLTNFVDVLRGWRSASSATRRRWRLVHVVITRLDRTFRCHCAHLAVVVSARDFSTNLTQATSSFLSPRFTHPHQQLSSISSAFTAWTTIFMY